MFFLGLVNGRPDPLRMIVELIPIRGESADGGSKENHLVRVRDRPPGGDLSRGFSSGGVHHHHQWQWLVLGHPRRNVDETFVGLMRGVDPLLQQSGLRSGLGGSLRGSLRRRLLGLLSRGRPNTDRSQ